MSVITTGGVSSEGNIVVTDGSSNEVVNCKATGQISAIERTITGSAWDLSTGNNWTVGAVAVPQPTSGVAGQSGTITITAAPTSWPAGGTLKYAGGTAPAPTTFPSVVPFYVQSPTSVLLGVVTEGIV